MAKTLALKIEVDAQTGKISKLGDEFRSFNTSVKKSDSFLSSFQKNILGIGAAVGGFMSLNEAVGSSVSSFLTLEEATTGVAKTTGMSAREIGNLRDNFREMTSTMKGFKTDELLSIAEAAGQLGIQGVEDISKFTEVIQMVSMTTDLTADEAAVSFARLSKSLNEPIDNIEKLTSTFNELSNTMTATVGDLLLFSQRMAGMATTFGLSTAELAGLSATMRDVGLNFELGGTAMNTIMGKMLKETKSFARISGESFEDFSKILKDKPIKALEAFLKSLNKMNETEKLKALEYLKLNGDGVSQTLLKLSSNTKLLAKNIGISNKAYEEGTSIRKEYEIASKTMSKNIDSMRNDFVLLGESIVVNFKEPMNDAINWMGDFARNLATGESSLFDFTKAVGKTAVGLSAMYGVMKVAQFAVFVGHITKLQVALVAAAAAQKALNIVMKMNPLYIGAAVIGGSIAAVSGYLVDYEKKIKKVGESFNKYIDTTQTKISKVEALGNAYKSIYENMPDGADKEKALKRVLDQIEKNSKAEIDASIKTTNKVIVETGKKTVGQLKLEDELIKKNKAAYEKFLKEKEAATKRFNSEYDKTFLKSFELEEKALQDSLREYKKYGVDRLKLDELYQKKHLDILYKDQDKNLKKALDAYEAAGEKEIAGEIKKVIEKNKITDEYSDILSDSQLQKAKDLSDEKIEIALKGEKEIVDEVVRMWDGVGKDMHNSIASAFDDIILKGGDFSKSLKNMFSGMSDSIVKPFTQGLSTGLSNAFAGFVGVGESGLTGSGLIGDFGSLLGSKESNTGGDYLNTLTSGVSDLFSNGAASIDGALGKVGLEGANTALADMGAQSTLGGAAMAGMAGYAVGSLGDQLFGTKTKAANYSAIGAAGGALVGGPVGAAIGGVGGALIGGMFGSKENKGTYVGMSDGIQGELDSLSDVLVVYDKFKEKSWFSSSTSYKTTDMGSDLSIYLADLDRAIEDVSQSAEKLFGNKIKLDADMFKDKIKVEDLSEVISREILKDITAPDFHGMFKSSGFFGNIGKKFATALSDNVDLDVIYDAWEDYATKIGVSTESAILEAVASISNMIEQQKLFNNEWFGNTFQIAENAANKAQDSFKSLADEMGQSDVSLSSFSVKFKEAMSGDKFLPENYEVWAELQVDLQAAAVETKNFAGALEGMISKYDSLITDIDKKIADINGTEWIDTTKIAEATTIAFGSIQDLVEKTKAAANPDEMLAYANQTVEMLARYTEQQQGFIDRAREGTEDISGLVEEVKRQYLSDITTLETAYNEKSVDLQDQLSKITESNNVALADFVAKNSQKEDFVLLVDQLKTDQSQTIEALNQQIDGATQAYNENKGELKDFQDGLISSIQEGDKASFDALDQILKDQQTSILGELKTALTGEKDKMETLLQQQLEQLQLIETGIINIAPEIDKSLTPLNNFAEAFPETMKSLDTLAIDVAESVKIATEPTAKAMENLPAQIDTSLKTAMEPIATEMKESRALSAALPEQINSSIATSMAPTLQSMDQMAKSMGEIAPGIQNGISQSMMPLNNSIDKMGISMSNISPDVQKGIMSAMRPVEVSMEQVARNVMQIAPSVRDGIMESMAPIQNAMDAVTVSMQSVSRGIEALAPALSTGIANAMVPMENALNTMTNSVGQIAPTMDRAMRDSMVPVQNAITGMTDSLSGLAPAMSSAVTSAMRPVETAMNSVANSMSGLSGSISSAISSSLSGLSSLPALEARVANATESTASNTSGLASAIGSAVSSAMSGFSASGIVTAVNSANTDISREVRTLASAANMIKTNTSNTASNTSTIASNTAGGTA